MVWIFGFIYFFFFKVPFHKTFSRRDIDGFNTKIFTSDCYLHIYLHKITFELITLDYQILAIHRSDCSICPYHCIIMKSNVASRRGLVSSVSA